MEQLLCKAVPDTQNLQYPTHAKNAKPAKKSITGIKTILLLFLASFACLLVHHSSFSSLIWVFQTSDGGSDHAISVASGREAGLKMDSG